MPLDLFYSYSHLNKENWLPAVKKYIDPLATEHYILPWSDRDLQPGDPWAKKIDRRLDEADIVLFIVTQDFINSDACNGEYQRALDRASLYEEKGQGKPVILALLLCGFTTPFAPDQEKLLEWGEYVHSLQDRRRLRVAYDRLKAKILDTHPELAARQQPAEAPNDAREAEAYLQRLREETGFINIGSIDRTSTQAALLPIGQVYVPLHICRRDNAPKRLEAASPPPDRGDRAEKRRLESALRHRNLIIEGDAGSGKSTFMRCLAFETEPAGRVNAAGSAGSRLSAVRADRGVGRAHPKNMGPHQRDRADAGDPSGMDDAFPGDARMGGGPALLRAEAATGGYAAAGWPRRSPQPGAARTHGKAAGGGGPPVPEVPHRGDHAAAGTTWGGAARRFRRGMDRRVG